MLGKRVEQLSLNSTGPTRTRTPTRTSSPTYARGSSRGSWRVRRARSRLADCPRTFVRHARFSPRGCRLGIRACTRVRTCTVHDKLSCTRLQNYTIDASLMSVSVSVSVPWALSFMQLASQLRELRLIAQRYLPPGPGDIPASTPAS